MSRRSKSRIASLSVGLCAALLIAAKRYLLALGLYTAPEDARNLWQQLEAIALSPADWTLWLLFVALLSYGLYPDRWLPRWLQNSASSDTVNLSDSESIPAHSDPWPTNADVRRIERITDAALRIFEARDMVPAARNSHQLALPFRSGDRDWRSETRAMLRAVVTDDMVEQYNKCLRSKHPEDAAYTFLHTLGAAISDSQLRGLKQDPAAS
ncbi:hypothetical protein GC176_23090 [bacterium]|nr:hypothetical protein [bacterium]